MCICVCGVDVFMHVHSVALICAAVSYTHLDVYKRQGHRQDNSIIICFDFQIEPIEDKLFHNTSTLLLTIVLYISS